MVDVYPPPRGERGPAHLSPDGHVVAVDEEDVDLDTRGELCCPPPHPAHRRPCKQLGSWPHNAAVVPENAPRCMRVRVRPTRPALRPLPPPLVL